MIFVALCIYALTASPASCRWIEVEVQSCSAARHWRTGRVGGRASRLRHRQVARVSEGTWSVKIIVGITALYVIAMGVLAYMQKRAFDDIEANLAAMNASLAAIDDDLGDMLNRAGPMNEDLDRINGLLKQLTK